MNHRLIAKRAYVTALRVVGRGIRGRRLLTADKRQMHGLFSGEEVTPRIHWFAEQFATPTGLNSDAMTAPRGEIAVLLLDIREPGYRFANEILLDPQRRLVTTYAGDPANLPSYAKPVRYAAKVDGTVAFVATDAPNYYHWMAYGLGMLPLYEKFRVTAERTYVGEQGAGGFRRETVTRAIMPSMLIDAAVSADRLLFAQIMCDEAITRSMSSYIRRLYVNDPEPVPGERLFVARGDVSWRRVIGEDRLIAKLRPLGYRAVTMDGLTVSEQAAMFSRAERIVAPHGAALTNLLFAPGGCRVVEILPQDHLWPFFFALAQHASCDYRYFAAASSGGGQRSDIVLTDRDIAEIASAA